MPPLPRGYEPLPYAGAPRSVPNYGTLGELMGLKARNSQQGWMQLASAFDRFVQNRRAQEQAQLERADVMAQRQSAEAMKREEIALRAAEREEAARMRREAAEEKAQLAAEKRGDSRAKAIGYGPMAEADVDTVMQSPERAGDVRYSFGPGTADGPELQPTQDQRKMIALEQAVSAQGGLVTPGGSVHMPPKPEPKRYGAPMRMADGTWKQFEAGQIPPDAKFWQEPKSASGPRPLTQNAEQALINRLTGQWTNATKPQREVKRQIQIMDAGLQAARAGDLAAGSEAVLQTFLKVLDPNSVVREGEFWRLREGQSLINRVRAAAQRFNQGGWVPLSELEKYANLAKEIDASMSKFAEPTRARIGKNADRYGIPHELIFDDDGVAQATPTPTPKPKVGRDANGNLVVLPKGKS